MNLPIPYGKEFSIAREADVCIKWLKNHSQLPFTGNDSSAGMEYEIQVAVSGNCADVDLPCTIEASSFYANTKKRAAQGDLSFKNIEALQNFIHSNKSGIWENSWVRCKESSLCDYAKRVFAEDLLADKRTADSPIRTDSHRFVFEKNGERWLRIPISYLLKLSLADMLGQSCTFPEKIQQTGRQLFSHFLSDNTSPEILSFTIVHGGQQTVGELAAQESARTYLFCQLLLQYANKHFGLTDSGQTCLLYNAPHAPYRQKLLNEIVPDGYYRHLFMSPCLSGWDRGEEKYQYMQLCHKTLSQSQLNTISKLKDAGIITNNLIVLPNTSNTCLANNGTHISLGSTLLTQAAQNPASGFSSVVEKYLGDLVIKIVEHFLPLFVSTYTAAPYRIDFADFHPEKVLGFLPHELDYTHLRMIWRRWKKKAHNTFLGHSFTPFGPHSLDWLFARTLGLYGDLVPDFRLIDYLVTLLSTENCPALNGQEANQDLLKEELAEMGIFDSRMSIYLPYRQRHFRKIGFSGFEGRSHSLFPSLLEDMAPAVDLQNSITAIAYQLILSGKVRHEDIPDSPFIESERRQIFFAAAIGLPTFFVKADTPNRFLCSILAKVRNQRASRRYKGYIRIPVTEYQQALCDWLLSESSLLTNDILPNKNINDLQDRLHMSEKSAYTRILRESMRFSHLHKRPERLRAEQFNHATETYYRTDLRHFHTREGVQTLINDCMLLEQRRYQLLLDVMNDSGLMSSASEFIRLHEREILTETLHVSLLRLVINICLVVIHSQQHS